jgi:peptidyl-prolyl cis-trans isomerase C
MVTMWMQEFQQNIADPAKMPADSTAERYAAENAKMGAAHILIDLQEDATTAAIDSARSAAAALMDSAKAGTPFGELAQRHRDGPSARRGGDLGTFSKERMVSEFAEAAYTLKEMCDV